MDTDGLRLFVLAADKLNITGAGKELGLAPAVASARLAKLEKSIGADLLHRTTRKVSLSTEGLEFLPYARDMIAKEDAARVALGQGKADISGRLRFTAPSTFAQQYIMNILPQFVDAHPNLTLDLRLSDKQIDLIEGSFDLALRNAVLDDSSLRGRKLADDKRILCASPEYLKKHGTPQEPDDLKQHHLIAFGADDERYLADQNGNNAVFSPKQSKSNLIIDDGLSHKLATLEGCGIAIHSIWSVHEAIKSGQLIHVLPGYQLTEQMGLWLIYPHSNVLSVKVRVFMDFLLERIGKEPPWV